VSKSLHRQANRRCRAGRRHVQHGELCWPCGGDALDHRFARMEERLDDYRQRWLEDARLLVHLGECHPQRGILLWVEIDRHTEALMDWRTPTIGQNAPQN
jgi:hypothetical protein